MTAVRRSSLDAVSFLGTAASTPETLPFFACVSPRQNSVANYGHASIITSAKEDMFSSLLSDRL